MPGNPSRPSLLDTLAERVVVADGAMGTMLQAADLSLDDFEGLEGCNEILNVSRPDVVRGVHDAYFRAGSDAVETNTFGANWAAPARRSPRRSPTGGRPRTARGGCSARWVPAPSCRRSGTCTTRFCAT